MARWLANSPSRSRTRRLNPYAFGSAGLIFCCQVQEGAGRDLVLGNVGIPSANLTTAPSPDGSGALVFNGTDTFVDFAWSRLYLAAQGQAPGKSSDVTITFLALFNSTAEMVGMEQGSDLDNTLGFGWGLNASGFLAGMHGNDFQGASSFKPSTGVWYAITISRDATANTYSYWVNGASQGSGSYTAAIGTGGTKTLTLGNRGVLTAGSTSNRGLAFNGKMADVRVYAGKTVEGALHWTSFDPLSRSRLRGRGRPTFGKTPGPPPLQSFAPPVRGGPLRFAPWLLEPFSPLPQLQAPPPRPAPVFTGILGTVNSQFGQLALGTVASSAVVAAPQTFLPTVRGGPLPFGPFALRPYSPTPHVPVPVVAAQTTPVPTVEGGPVRGAPYYRQVPTDQPPLVAFTPPAPPVLGAPPQVSGGPMGGVPWNPGPRTTPDANALNVAPPVPPPQIPPPSVEGGPLRFGPYSGLRLATPPVVLPVRPAAAPSPPGPLPAVSGGPIPGAPWQRGGFPSLAPVPGPNPPQPTPPLVTGATGVVNRVPSDDRRLARHTEVVADILNSLIQTGQLGQVGPANWQLQVTVLTFNGRTGAVTFQLSDLPTSGVQAGTYAFATVTVDQYGRITAASAPAPSLGVPLIGTGAVPAFGTQQVAVDSRAGAVFNDGNSGNGTVNFDLTVSDCHLLTLTGTPTLALVNVGNVRIFTLILKQDGSGSRTVNWFSGILWNGGSAPTLTTTAGKYDIVTFVNLGGGVYLGQPAGQNF